MRVKLVDEPNPQPKQAGRESSPILCPVCLRRTLYIFQLDEFQCPAGHGTAITNEELHSYFDEVLT